MTEIMNFFCFRLSECLALISLSTTFFLFLHTRDLNLQLVELERQRHSEEDGSSREHFHSRDLSTAPDSLSEEYYEQVSKSKVKYQQISWPPAWSRKIDKGIQMVDSSFVWSDLSVGTIWHYDHIFSCTGVSSLSSGPDTRYTEQQPQHLSTLWIQNIVKRKSPIKNKNCMIFFWHCQQKSNV